MLFTKKKIQYCLVLVSLVLIIGCSKPDSNIDNEVDHPVRGITLEEVNKVEVRKMKTGQIEEYKKGKENFELLVNLYNKSQGQPEKTPGETTPSYIVKYYLTDGDLITLFSGATSPYLQVEYKGKTYLVYNEDLQKQLINI